MEPNQQQRPETPPGNLRPAVGALSTMAFVLKKVNCLGLYVYSWSQRQSEQNNN